MLFNESIKEARLKAGLSQEKAGKAINRTRNAIKGYESGISSPNPDQLATLCKLYKTNPNDLLGFQQQNEEAKMKHTKLPWFIDQLFSDSCIIGAKNENKNLEICTVWGGEITSEIDAAFIVKACNGYENLELLLKRISVQMNLDIEINGSTQWPDKLIEDVKEAVKKAEAE